MAHGILALQYCGIRLTLKVCMSANGYYLGTENEDGPISRESVQYWRTFKEAQQALDTAQWNQRITP